MQCCLCGQQRKDLSYPAASLALPCYNLLAPSGRGWSTW